MKYALDPAEARILGVLIEKQLSTPEYYPLTLNALVNACNQKSNRDPVLSLDEAAVVQALGSLRKQRLVWQVMTQGSRAPKYEHNLKEVAGFSDFELAILCELMVRGPQTIGELRTRASRMAEFFGLSDVEHTLKKLITHESGPFAVQLPRRPGHKENRYAQLFSDADVSVNADESSEKVSETRCGDDDLHRRLTALENTVADLQNAFADLRDQFMEFKRELE